MSLRSEARRPDPPRGPDLSVVVVVYNMAREAPRTLYSLSAAYQRHIAAADYEVLVVDNGSNPPFDPSEIDKLQGNFKLIRLDPAPPSPAHAINRGLAEARGKVIGVLIDGARIATPGLLHFARHGARLHRRAVVAALNWQLGYDSQREAIEAGYDKQREDALLASIGWPADGYRLFEIGSTVPDYWFGQMVESNALFMTRRMWEQLEGYDERFDVPGGGLVNLDTFRRAVEMPQSRLVVLLGEATFHQMHGGIASNAARPTLEDSLAAWKAQYEAIRGRSFAGPVLEVPPSYVGTLPRHAMAHFLHAAWRPQKKANSPLGEKFDPSLWSLQPPVRPADPIVAALVDLAHSEFRAGRLDSTAAVARLARNRAPDEPEPLRLLSLLGRWQPVEGPKRVPLHLALGEAYRILGDKEKAAAEFRAALELRPGIEAPHLGLAKLRLPGEDHYQWLRRLHATIRPAVYLEIGVGNGASLALAQPPTCAIGVDPTPAVHGKLAAETHVFVETSDQFFAARRWESLLAGRTVELGFVDGQHLFEQALRDFINLERYCGPRSVLLLHDTLPLDEQTQARTRATQFYTGDVWRAVLCLKHYRSDLEVFTIAAPPSGLTVILKPDSASRVLSERFDEAVARFLDVPYAQVESRLGALIGLVPNDWDAVRERLRVHRVL